MVYSAAEPTAEFTACSDTITALNAMTTYTNAAAGGGKLFYRVRLVP